MLKLGFTEGRFMLQNTPLYEKNISVAILLCTLDDISVSLGIFVLIRG